MTKLEDIIDQLSTRADDCDLLALLAATDHARRYNAELARELRDVVLALRRELGQRQTPILRPEFQVGS
ncbi:hypothetical protein [Bradyrhizobium sp. STM 3843]|uniref:hypothetical protein n=1 Tax=unclassified Bradyrhizobium TaxID=2631580 RepID=UPI0005697967|nr:hypothetical protein [Bradyrhizobium sp. STM 3843]